MRCASKMALSSWEKSLGHLQNRSTRKPPGGAGRGSFYCSLLGWLFQLVGTSVVGIVRLKSLVAERNVSVPLPQLSGTGSI